MSGLYQKLKRSVGWFPKVSEASVIFYGETQADFDRAQSLINDVMQQGGRVNVVLFSSKSGNWQGHEICSLPIGIRPTFALLLGTLKVRCVVALSALPDRFEAVCQHRGTAIVRASVSASEILSNVGRERSWGERSNRPVGRFFADQLYKRLEAGDGRVGGVTRIGNVGQLKQRLGAPQTILCLGNGPSSEGDAVRSVKYDVLFRANHSWQARGFLTEPDVVFTGMQASMKKIAGAVLCVLGETSEKVLLMVRAKNALSGKLEYVVAGPKQSALPLEANDEIRPTSGAVMVAMAVALKPETLVIAGIDLFSHPDGAYPDDKNTPNAYTSTHSIDHELDFIIKQLELFEGELVLLSEVLAKEWRDYKGASRN